MTQALQFLLDSVQSVTQMGMYIEKSCVSQYIAEQKLKVIMSPHVFHFELQ